MCPIYVYSCKACGSEVERYEPRVDREKPPLCECGKRTAKVFSTSFAQHFGEGAYATSNHGSQWRNQWGRKFRRDNEGENSSVAKRAQQLIGGKNA